jgi:uncharacterized protein (TIGR03435 family)
MLMTTRNGRLVLMGHGLTIGKFIEMLSDPSGRPVVDRIGLTGRYDFNLEFAPQGTAGLLGIPLAPPEAGGPMGAAPANALEGPADLPPALVTAVQEQLGLKLEPKRGPLPVLVIAQAEKTPVAN